GRYGCCWGTWQIYILPYIEQDNMFRVYVNLEGNDRTGARYSGGTNPPNVTRNRLKVLTCPSDTPNAPCCSGPITRGGSGGITSHNYAVNYGNTSFFQAPLNGVPFGGAPFSCYPPQWLNPSQIIASDGSGRNMLQTYNQLHP